MRKESGCDAEGGWDRQGKEEGTEKALKIQEMPFCSSVFQTLHLHPNNTHTLYMYHSVYEKVLTVGCSSSSSASGC